MIYSYGIRKTVETWKWKFCTLWGRHGWLSRNWSSPSFRYDSRCSVRQPRRAPKPQWPAQREAREEEGPKTTLFSSAQEVKAQQEDHFNRSSSFTNVPGLGTKTKQSLPVERSHWLQLPDQNLLTDLPLSFQKQQPLWWILLLGEWKSRLSGAGAGAGLKSHKGWEKKYRVQKTPIFYNERIIFSTINKTHVLY